MTSRDIIIVGGGAAGMFAAAVLAEQAPELKVLVIEKQPQPLAKVRISGGGRCNLTHTCEDIQEFVENYPRGRRELIGPFSRFGATETIEWFESRGVPLITLEDGCIFPRSDRAADIVGALLTPGIELWTDAEVSAVESSQTGFLVKLARSNQSSRRPTPASTDGASLACRRLLVATGGGAFIEGLGHTVEPCVPSLFTFNTSDTEFTGLSGITVEDVEIHAGKLKASGTLLITHTGVSGPATLKLSSFGARSLAAAGYKFEMRINWRPSLDGTTVFRMLRSQRESAPAQQIGKWSPLGLPSRLWKLLLKRARLDPGADWGTCSDKALHSVAAQVNGSTLPITGKNRHKEEFVTCGGIRLSEVDFKTMESRIVPGLYFAGEVLDIDALTGGFNLQAAWTTGYIAAQSLLTC